MRGGPLGHRLHHLEDGQGVRIGKGHYFPSTVMAKTCPPSGAHSHDHTQHSDSYPLPAAGLHNKRPGYDENRNSKMPDAGRNKKKTAGRRQTNGSSTANSNNGNWKNGKRHRRRSVKHFNGKSTTTAGKRTACGTTNNDDSKAQKGSMLNNDNWRKEDARKNINTMKKSANGTSGDDNGDASGS